MKTIAILASGNGSNAENIIRKVKAKVAFVFSDHRDAKVLGRAKRLKVPYVSFELKDFESKDAYESKLALLLKKENVDLIVLAGYMRILSDRFVKSFPKKIINIHPSLLPEFKGTTHAIREAFQAGVKKSGVTVHYVIPELDSGPVILQEAVPRLKSDTLAQFEKRIHKKEFELYPKAIKEILKCR